MTFETKYNIGDKIIYPPVSKTDAGIIISITCSTSEFNDYIIFYNIRVHGKEIDFVEEDELIPVN